MTLFCGSTSTECILPYPQILYQKTSLIYEQNYNFKKIVIEHLGGKYSVKSAEPRNKNVIFEDLKKDQFIDPSYRLSY